MGERFFTRRVGIGERLVGEGEPVFVRLEILNKLPWPLKKDEFHLVNITGPAHLEPAGTPLPRKILGPDEIPPDGVAVQEFALMADDVGHATAKMKFQYCLADTNLCIPVEKSVSFDIHPA